MREILFKGKRLGNGEWVEGDLFHNDNTNYPMTLIGGLILSRNKYTDEIDIDGYGLIEVDPETVCQYTGIKEQIAYQVLIDITIWLDRDKMPF